jgi:hypothetical protein
MRTEEEVISILLCYFNRSPTTIKVLGVNPDPDSRRTVDGLRCEMMHASH